MTRPRTAASIVELIEMYLAEAEVAVIEAESTIRVRRERVITIRAILDDAEKNVGAE